MARDGLRDDLALSAEAVRNLLARRVARWDDDLRVGDVRLLVRRRQRLVVRYELKHRGGRESVIGKWYATGRGGREADALAQLRSLGFAGPPFAVPEPIGYAPEVKVLFVEDVEGSRLSDVVGEDETLARRAGAWLASFHQCGFTNERARDPAVQRASAARWTEEEPRLRVRPLVAELDDALALLPRVAVAVHYDYSPTNVLLQSGGATVTVDFDEIGMGDPAFDIAHMDAHLELLSLRRFGAPGMLAAARDAFVRGYAMIAPVPERRPALVAFAWFKLAYVGTVLAASATEIDYALESATRSLAAA
jgi:aminoglycoside phosphotransferase (APT) family kinase protein